MDLSGIVLRLPATLPPPIRQWKKGVRAAVRIAGGRGVVVIEQDNQMTHLLEVLIMHPADVKAARSEWLLDAPASIAKAAQPSSHIRGPEPSRDADRGVSREGLPPSGLENTSYDFL